MATIAVMFDRGLGLDDILKADFTAFRTTRATWAFPPSSKDLAIKTIDRWDELRVYKFKYTIRKNVTAGKAKEQ